MMQPLRVSRARMGISQVIRRSILKIPHGYAVMKPKLFIGCNMRPRLQRRIPVER